MKIKEAAKLLIGPYLKFRVPRTADNTVTGNPDAEARKMVRHCRRVFNHAMPVIDNLPEPVRYEVFSAIWAAYVIGLEASEEDGRIEIVSQAVKRGQIVGDANKTRADKQWRNDARKLDKEAIKAGHEKKAARALHSRMGRQVRAPGQR